MNHLHPNGYKTRVKPDNVIYQFFKSHIIICVHNGMYLVKSDDDKFFLALSKDVEQKTGITPQNGKVCFYGKVVNIEPVYWKEF